MKEPAGNSLDLVERLFTRGLGADAATRRALLKPFRDQQPQIAAEVEALWRHGDSDNGPESDPMDQLAAFSRQTWETRDGASPPKIDPQRYRIIEPLGHGGMGQVFKAEQQYPVARLVAIKILPLLHLRPDRSARFAAEQRALALIKHRNVAAVFDRGQTERGLPYYVMEYLEPLSITAYCDEQRLPISARLALFIQVCEGIGQAHRKGIIHRDINPANVLISETESGPVAKVIDFGIAKFQDPEPLRDPTKTILGTVMGTPGYMSPEQARGASEEAIDTLSDIYSLGALLYELLVGRAPFVAPGQNTSLEDLILALKSFVPYPPSHHLKPTETRARRVAAARSSDAYSLQKQLKRELDWIAMKALDHHPAARYQTARALAADVARYLAGRPLAAAPPHPFYRWRKLARYHRRAVAGVALFGLTLTTALVLISLALVRTSKAESAARQALNKVQAVNAFNRDIFMEVVPSRSGRSITGLELVAKAERQIPARYGEQPELEAATRAVVAFAFKGLGDYQRALENYRRQFALQGQLLGNNHPETLTTMTEIAFLLASQGQQEQAWVFYRQAFEGLQSQLSPRDPTTLRAASGLAWTSANLGQVSEAETLFQQTLALQTETLAAGATDSLQTRHNFALFRYRQGQDQKAASLWTTNLKILLAKPDQNRLLRFRTRHHLALLNSSRGAFSQAIAQNRALWHERVQVLGPDHPETLLSLNNLAVAHTENGSPEQAAALLRAYLDDCQNPTSATVMKLRHNLGNALLARGDTAAARATLAPLWADRARELGAHHRDSLRTRWTLAEIHQRDGELHAARAIFSAVLGLAEQYLGAADRDSKLYRSEWKRRYPKATSLEQK